MKFWKRKITIQEFEKAVGRPPENDDLERCNCPEAGQDGHESCGWNYEDNLPQFLVSTN